MDVSIREITSSEISLIQELAEKAYFPSYEKIHTREQNEFSFNEMYSTESLCNQFNNLGSRFFVISEGNEHKGYMALMKIDDNQWLLDKLYILPGNQGEGYGKSLITHAERVIANTPRQDNSNGDKSVTIMLKVNRRNNAVSFYKHHGYSITGEWDIEIADGKWIMDGYDMAKTIEIDK